MSYQQLTPEERYVIAHLNIYGLSLREIARRLKRHHSTISRELRRNGPPPPFLARYWYDSAQARCDARKAKARHRRRLHNEELYQYVVQSLQARLSPQLISGRLYLDYPQQARMRVSTEQIYRWVYRDALSGGQLYRCLCRLHKRRRRQRRYGSLRGLIKGRVPIHERPAVVTKRRRFGDWEGDTLYGGKTRTCLLTQVERKSRYLIVSKISNREAATVASANIAQFEQLPRSWRKTLTLDNGKEFADFKRVENATGLRVYFADPYAAWQRGSNENVNGLIRRIYPKGTDFSKVSDRELAAVAHWINNRPRKCLGYRTPHEVVLQATSGALGK
ncbi:MAG: IS30 family transposase [Betaproteobacteria bacterium]|nr:MAG: IS30 family transposase [Betaproteobacteria bacterium]